MYSVVSIIIIFRTTIVRFLVVSQRFSLNIELPHEIFYSSRSDDNRRAAGAVGFCSWLIFFHKSSLLKVVGPAARHFCVFCVFCVFCGFYNSNFSCFSCLSWLKICHRISRQINVFDFRTIRQMNRHQMHPRAMAADAAVIQNFHMQFRRIRLQNHVRQNR